MSNRNIVRESLDIKVRMAKEVIRKFQEDLSDNAFYALEWSEKTFEAAAIVQEASRVLKALDKGKDPKELLDGLNGEIRRMARNPKRSTSAASNLAYQYQLSAMSELAELLEADMKQTK